jgi:hypothetical protein
MAMLRIARFVVDMICSFALGMIRVTHNYNMLRCKTT